MKFFSRNNIIYALITVLVLGLVCLGFVTVITNDTRKDTEDQMRELSNQTINTIANKIHTDSVCLRSIAETVGNSTMQLNTEALRQYLERKRSIYGFGDIVVVDLKGNALSAIGAKLPNLKQMDFVEQAQQGKTVLHQGYSYVNSHEQLVRIALPLKRNNRVIAVLYGVYMPNQLRSLLTDRLFNSHGRIKLITSHGDMIFSPDKALPFRNVE